MCTRWHKLKASSRARVVTGEVAAGGVALPGIDDLGRDVWCGAPSAARLRHPRSAHRSPDFVAAQAADRLAQGSCQHSFRRVGDAGASEFARQGSPTSAA